MSIWGDIALDGARRSVTVEREFGATPSELWSAITEPDRLARWIGRCTVLDDGYRLDMGPVDGRAVVTGRVLVCDPERRIVIGWRFSGDGQTEADTELDVSIAPVGDTRVRLTLQHRRVQQVTAAVYGAGWEDVLTHLAREIGDAESPERELGYEGRAADPAAFDAALEQYRRDEAALVAATMIREDGLSGVHLERLLDAPAEQVWDAITLPGLIGRWLWPVVEWPDDPARHRRLEQGDRFVLGDANVPEGTHELEVLGLDEGRMVSFTWGPGGSAVSIRIESRDGATLLVLDQDPIPDVFGGGRLRSAPDFAAGWHSLVDGLALLLSATTVQRPEALWEAAYEIYTEGDAR